MRPRRESGVASKVVDSHSGLGQSPSRGGNTYVPHCGHLEPISVDAASLLLSSMVNQPSMIGTRVRVSDTASDYMHEVGEDLADLADEILAVGALEVEHAPAVPSRRRSRV